MTKKFQKTAQRAAIMDYLKDNLSHPTVEEIYQAALKQLNTISKATVYNTMLTLKQQGIVRELSITGLDCKRYDPDIRHHTHLICTDCGKIVDVHFSLPLEISVAQQQGFEIRDFDIQFYGICSACKKADQKPTQEETSKKR
ncbi:MAG TPA: transcriptional repressor [Smithellaceae bacterium]|nr:transcriptional repressor [Smithellaceae bacterium]